MTLVDRTGVLPRLAESGGPIALELGCGERKRRADAIGIDARALPGVDLVGDVFEALAALPDGCADPVSSHHFFEHVDDVPRLGARVVQTDTMKIAVFRTAGDQVFALRDHCPHLGGPLSQGIVHGESVTCPLHNWVFDLNTGQAQGADEGQIATYPVRVEAARILLDGQAVSAGRDAA